VQTIEFTTADANSELPPPMSVQEVENMTLAQKRMAAMVMEILLMMSRLTVPAKRQQKLRRLWLLAVQELTVMRMGRWSKVTMKTKHHRRGRNVKSKKRPGKSSERRLCRLAQSTLRDL
jgi:hypothetical protein